MANFSLHDTSALGPECSIDMGERGGEHPEVLPAGPPWLGTIHLRSQGRDDQGPGIFSTQGKASVPWEKGPSTSQPHHYRCRGQDEKR